MDQGKQMLDKAQNKQTNLVGLDSNKRKLFFSQFADQFAAVSASIKPERIVQLAVLATANPAIAKCDIKTVIGALMEVTTLGFEPVNSLNQCALIPYKNKLTVQIMYQGYIDLAYRSGLLQSIYGDVVREGDTIEFAKGTNGFIKHIPLPTSYDQQIKYAYVVAHLNGGGQVFEIWPVQKLIAHRNRYARGYDREDSPWVTAQDQMFMKSVLKQLMKFLPKSIEFRRAETLDDNVIEYDMHSQKLSYNDHGVRMEDDIPEPEIKEAEVVEDGDNETT
jgi:recombination protein RecT